MAVDWIPVAEKHYNAVLFETQQVWGHSRWTQGVYELNGILVFIFLDGVIALVDGFFTWESLHDVSIEFINFSIGWADDSP